MLPPGFEGLPHGTGPGHQSDQANPFLQTQPYGPSTIGLAIGYDASDALEPQREALLNRQWCLDTITAIAIPNPHPEREAAIATHPQTEEHLLELIAPIFTMSIGWTRGHRVVFLLRLLPIGRHLSLISLISAIEGNGCRILMEPRRGDGIDLQCLQGHSTKYLVEIGSKQGIQDLAQTIIIERGTL